MKDDRGHALAPTLDDAVAGRSAYAAIAFDADTFSYGMKATIEEVDAMTGKKIELEVSSTPAGE